MENQVTSLPEMVVDAEKLPSRGLGYPEGSKIFYRSYTFGEIKKASATNDLDLLQLIELVMSGIRVEQFDKFSMSFIDMLYVGLLRRVSSQGDLRYEIPYHCEKCGKVNKAVFGSNDIDFEEISKDCQSVPLEFELGEKTVQMTYPTVQMMMDVKKGTKKGKGVKDSLAISASTIINMKFEDAYNLLSNLVNNDDIETLEEVDELLYHGIKPIESVCKNKVTDESTGNENYCSHTNHVSIEGKELLIRPFREGERPKRDKIRFSSK